MRQSILRRAVLAGVCTALMGTAGALFAANGQSLFGEIGQGATMQAKVNTAWNQLFYGDNNTQRVYFPVGSDMAYIKDINNNDVRTEGMSYGMMIAAQMNKKTEFNRLWKWAKTYMQHTSGPYKGYFSWQNRTDGSKIDNHAASDGEAYFVQALFTASGRWGNGTGIYNYRAEANAILNTMLHQKDDGSGVNSNVHLSSRAAGQPAYRRAKTDT